jgi:Mor family transcriptional regulator
MAKHHQAFEDKVKRAIRDAMAYDPLLKQSALVEHLDKKFNHSFDYAYISKLSKKVVGEARREFDTAKIGPRLAALRENYRISREALLSIIERGLTQSGKNKPWDSVMVDAARSLVVLDIAVLNAEVANGLYKNLDEAAAKLSYPALPEEQRGHIVSAFQKWNILPPGSLVEHVTIHATRAITPAE